MSRTQSQGLEFFPVEVDFFSDKKVRILKARYGADGLAIYLYLLCMIYREGYYTRVDEDFIYVISEELSMSSETVQQVMTFLLRRSMFNEQLFKSDAILTSDGIQERWQKAIKTRALKTPMKVESYWLLSQENTAPYIKRALFGNSSTKKDFNSEKKELNSENYPYKEKESKVNIVSSPYNPPKGEEMTAEESGQAQFFAKFPSVVIDNYSTELRSLTNEDWAIIIQRFEESEWLRENCKTLSMLCRLSKRIIAGDYAPFKKRARDAEDQTEEQERRERAAYFEKLCGKGTAEVKKQ